MAINGKKIGLALSGGAVRGAAHLGVIEVLEREGIRPDYIAGTSIGAMVGAGYASGRSVQEMIMTFKKMRWHSVLTPSFLRPLSLFNTKHLEKWLRREFRRATFDRLQIPFHAVACDINTGKAVALCEGDVAEAVCASVALPGLFEPRQRHGATLVDGGIVNNLPVDVVRAMGADYVIAVDLLPPFESGTPPRSFLDVWQRSFYLMLSSNHPSHEQADFYITPKIGHLSFTDFSCVPDLLQCGRTAAVHAYPQIKAALQLRDAPPQAA